MFRAKKAREILKLKIKTREWKDLLIHTYITKETKVVSLRCRALLLNPGDDTAVRGLEFNIDRRSKYGISFYGMGLVEFFGLEEKVKRVLESAVKVGLVTDDLNKAFNDPLGRSIITDGKSTTLNQKDTELNKALADEI